jgi:hypothetical protein
MDELAESTAARVRRVAGSVASNAAVGAAGALLAIDSIAERAGVKTRKGKYSKLRIARAALKPKRTALTILDASTNEFKSRVLGSIAWVDKSEPPLASSFQPESREQGTRVRSTDMDSVKDDALRIVRRRLANQELRAMQHRVVAMQAAESTPGELLEQIERDTNFALLALRADDYPDAVLLQVPVQGRSSSTRHEESVGWEILRKPDQHGDGGDDRVWYLLADRRIVGPGGVAMVLDGLSAPGDGWGGRDLPLGELAVGVRMLRARCSWPEPRYGFDAGGD